MDRSNCFTPGNQGLSSVCNVYGRRVSANPVKLKGQVVSRWQQLPEKILKSKELHLNRFQWIYDILWINDI